MTFDKIWGSLSYIFAVYIAVMMVAQKMPKRNHFALRQGIAILLLTGYKFLFDNILPLLPFDGYLFLFIRTLDSFFIYVISALSVFACFECNFWAVLFCTTAGYCMQHMSQRTYSIFVHSIGLTNEYWNALILIGFTVAFYLAIYYLFIKPADYRGVMLDNKVQISVSFFAIFITIFLNSFALRAASDTTQRNYIMLFSAIVSVLVIYIEFGWLAAKKATLEKDVIKRMANSAKKQYQLEKDIVDTINIKMHDLKHQLGRFNDRLGENEIDIITEDIKIYDSFCQSGNNMALNVVLTSKGLICEKRGINFTCLLDAEALSFLSEQDTYTLFCNMIDNAIEAVEKIEDPEKKVIGITARVGAGRIAIHEENYFAQKPQLVDGLPQTTKNDKTYHGFGVKSIRYISEKYGGSCSINLSGDIFEMDVVLPLQ